MYIFTIICLLIHPKPQFRIDGEVLLLFKWGLLGSSPAADAQMTLLLLQLDPGDFSASCAKGVDKTYRKMGGERPRCLNIHGHTFS